MSVAVKICGLRRPEDVIAVNEVQADYAGFVFFEKSKRNIRFDQASQLLERLDNRIKSVAVCVSPNDELIKNIIQRGFDIIQIHGTISVESLKQIPIPVWQAVNISALEKEPPIQHGFHTSVKEEASGVLDPNQFLRLPQITGYVVDGAQYGGGKTFGWETKQQAAQDFSNSIKAAASERLFILAGGLNADNVQTGIRLLNPDVVDVSSGVEKNGVKDSDLIKKFVGKVRER